MSDERELPADFLERLEQLASAYLSSEDPHLQSGFGGGAERWRAEREPILQAVTEGGELLDVGCANGLLLESLVAWAAERGIRIAPYGLDQSADLVALAKARLPGFAGHFFVGNAWSWAPPRRFRSVYSLIDVVPEDYLEAYVSRLLDRCVAPGGRLVLGSYGSVSRKRPPVDVASVLESFGHRVAGSASGGAGPTTRFAWIQAPASRGGSRADGAGRG